MTTLAITSNGADVKSQTFDGWDVYNVFKKDGKLGNAKAKGERARSMEASFKLADDMDTHFLEKA